MSGPVRINEWAVVARPKILSLCVFEEAALTLKKIKPLLPNYVE
jgi:hypothetical protein